MVRSYEEKFGICTNCGDACEVIIVDVGIGPYEYGSIRGWNSQDVVVSKCCESRAVDNYGNTITMADMEEADV